MGSCYRSDCWFSHDMSSIPCKFWYDMEIVALFLLPPHPPTFKAPLLLSGICNIILLFYTLIFDVSCFPSDILRSSAFISFRSSSGCLVHVSKAWRVILRTSPVLPRPTLAPQQRLETHRRKGTCITWRSSRPSMGRAQNSRTVQVLRGCGKT